jgi:hypothetical protein
VEDDVIENVSEFFLDGLWILALDGVDEFVGLFQEIGEERFVGLLGIPRATARGAEFVGGGD